MSDDREAARYHRLQLWLALVELAVTLAYLLAVLLSGGALLADRVAARLSGAWWWRVAAVAALAAAGHTLLTFPLAWTRGFWLRRRYGLLHQPLGAWLGDRLKGALIGAGLGLAALEVLYGLLRATGLWWLIAAGVFFVASAVMATLFPVVVLPLFYRLIPLGDPVLEARLLALAREAGVRAVGVWVADQSRRSRTANAALVGLGRTRRIILFDTLIREFAPAEIESVLAHELGHHVHGDLLRGLLAQGALTLVTFRIADGVLRAGLPWLHLDGPADPAGVVWLASILTTLGLIATPLSNGFSRWRERRADDFALALTRDRSAFIGAMERLGALNLAERRPHRLKEILLYSHPSLERRIARAKTEPGRLHLGPPAAGPGLTAPVTKEPVMNLRRTLRALVEKKAGLVVPGAYDGVSARLVEEAGFPAVYMTGYGASASRLGLPDLGFAGLAEMADHARNLAAVVGIPLIADADTGYGNALNVRRTVAAYEAAGVAALHIEDQVAPKRCGHLAGHQVIPRGEFAGKIRAAVEARKDPDLLVIARTDAISAVDVDEALRRGEAAVKAGADVLFIEAPRDEAQVERVARAFDTPLLYNYAPGGRSPLLPFARLRALRFAIILLPVDTLLVAVKAVRQFLGDVRERDDVSSLADRYLDFRQFNELIGVTAHLELADRYKDPALSGERSASRSAM